MPPSTYFDLYPPLVQLGKLKMSRDRSRDQSIWKWPRLEKISSATPDFGHLWTGGGGLTQFGLSQILKKNFTDLGRWNSDRGGNGSGRFGRPAGRLSSYFYGCLSPGHRGSWFSHFNSPSQGSPYFIFLILIPWEFLFFPPSTHLAVLVQCLSPGRPVWPYIDEMGASIPILKPF